MRIMVDTNVIMDILQRREPFFTDSYQAVHSIIKEDGECMLSASAATDIFYMLRKALQSPQQARERLAQLAQLVTFADVAGLDIHTALSRPMSDFEDAVVDAVAERNEVDYMRNTLGRTCRLLEVLNFLIDPLQMRFNAFS